MYILIYIYIVIYITYIYIYAYLAIDKWWLIELPIWGFTTQCIGNGHIMIHELGFPLNKAVEKNRKERYTV